MLKRIVLNYIRNHMSHETMETRNEIFQAINDGCIDALYFSRDLTIKDDLQSRISWTVGQLVENDKEFRARCGDVDVRRSVSMATQQEIAKSRG